METFVGSFIKIECNKSVLFKLLLILWIGVSLDVTLVKCTPALTQSEATYMAPIPANRPQRYRSLISTLSTLADDTKQDQFSISSGEDSDYGDSDSLQDLSHSMSWSSNALHRLGISKRRPSPLKPRRVMSKKALSLFAHWKPSHYTSNEDSDALASDVISAVARGHTRPMGGPLRWGRR